MLFLCIITPEGTQPHLVKVEREFENGGWLFGDSEATQGIEYLKANRPEDAIARWEEGVKRDPGNTPPGTIWAASTKS